MKHQIVNLSQFFVILAAFMLLAIQGVYGQTVAMDPATVESPAAGEQFTLNINITGGTNVAGYQLTVTFDPTALSYVSIANGDYLPAGAFATPPNLTDNQVIFGAASLTGLADGDGTLATVTFTVVEVKSSTIGLEAVVSDPTATPIAVTVEGGMITLEGGMITLPPARKPDLVVGQPKILSGHTDIVWSITYSSDGLTLASGSADATVRLWDTQTGALKKSITSIGAPVTAVDYSPSGHRLASADASGQISFWDANTGEFKSRRAGRAHEGESISSLAYNPQPGNSFDISHLAISQGRFVELINFFRPLYEVDGLYGSHRDSVFQVLYSPDGRTLATSSADKTIKLWSVITKNHKRTLSGHTDSVYGLAYSPDGLTLASGSADHTIRLWDANTGEHLRTLTGHTSSVWGVSFSPDGLTLASSSFDNTVRLWDTNTGETKQTLSGHTDSVYGLAYSPDGSTLASGDAEGTILLWDLTSVSGDGSTPPPVSNPDLVVGQPTVSQSTLAPGASFTLSATVRNQGAGSAAATTLRYYRSTNTTISTRDTEVGTDIVGALGANQSGAESISLTAPSSTGTYYYGACVAGVSGESSSNNNCSAAVSITVPGTPVVSTPSHPFIYWTDAGTGKIQRANLDGSNIVDLVTTGLEYPFDIVLDVAGGKMYWTDAGTDAGTAKIQRANLDGSNVEDLVTTGLVEPYGLTLDVAGGKMYWIDDGAGKIQRANLDGSNVEDLVTQGLIGPRGIALDVAGGKMYWTDVDMDKIQRANLDGSNVQDLVTQGLENPFGIALDVAGGKMYWTDRSIYSADKIQRANLDGSNVQTLVTQRFENPGGIALDVAGGKMYWIDIGEVGEGAQWGKEKIQCANLDGSNVQTLVTRAQGLALVWGIAVGFSSPVDPGPIVSTPSQPFIYWTDTGTDKIQRANLDGSNIVDLVTQGLSGPDGLALDVTGGKMYWTDWGTAKIQRANLDGSNVEDLVTQGLRDPDRVALDVGGGKMYWTDWGTAKIQRANLDGSNVQNLVTQGLRDPDGLALDVGGGKMYWTDWGTDKIQRANLDGSNIEDLVTQGVDPYGLALDVGGGKMYWTSRGTDKIQRANLDGSNVEDLVTQGVESPSGIVLDVTGGKMYWTDKGTDKIQRANLDGSNVEDLVTRTQGLRGPDGIAISIFSPVDPGPCCVYAVAAVHLLDRYRHG